MTLIFYDEVELIENYSLKNLNKSENFFTFVTIENLNLWQSRLKIKISLITGSLNCEEANKSYENFIVEYESMNVFEVFN